MKVLLTEKQLDVLKLYINENEKKPILQEGLKEVALGVLLLMGVKLSGMNAQIGNDALNNESTLKEIESTLISPKIETLAEKLENIGVKNPMDLIEKNRFKLVVAFNETAKNRGFNLKLTKIYNEDELK